MDRPFGAREYEYGLVWMDAQHRGFIDLFNRLSDSCDKGECSALEIMRVSKFIEWYTSDHFTIEEAYMKLFRYPRLEQHKREHLKFVSDFENFTQTSLKKATEAGTELVMIMADYILTNISHEDQELARFLKKKGVK